MGRKKEKTPAQKARAELMAAHSLKAGAKANLWITKCLYTGQDIVLLGDDRYEHFYACEGDPHVARAWYERVGQANPSAGVTKSVAFDARVELVSGEIQFRAIGSRAPTKDDGRYKEYVNAAAQMGGEYLPVTLRDLDALSQRVLNWRRALRFWRAGWSHQLSEIESIMLVRLHQRGSWTIGDFIHAYSAHEPSLVIAAIVRLIHKRVLSSDMDSELFCGRTKVWLRGAGP